MRPEKAIEKNKSVSSLGGRVRGALEDTREEDKDAQTLFDRVDYAMKWITKDELAMLKEEDDDDGEEAAFIACMVKLYFLSMQRFASGSRWGG